MPEIFLNYRRDDSAGHAGRLFDVLRARFGDESVFMDITDIEAGVDFTQALGHALSSCRVVLVLIGTQWLTAVDSAGRRRLDNPNDHVRLEIEHALARAAHVIPVLVRGARMPGVPDLPESLQPLVLRQAFEISDTRWTYDTGQLLHVVERDAGLAERSNVDRPAAAVEPRTGSSAGVRRFLRLAVPLVALVGLLGFVMRNHWWESASRAGPVAAARSDAPAGAPRVSFPPADAAAAGVTASPGTRIAATGQARAGLVSYNVLGGLVLNEANAGRKVRLFVRITNLDARAGVVLTADAFRLLADQQALPPTEAPVAALMPQSTLEAWVSFPASSGGSGLQLRVGDPHGAMATIPIDMRPAAKDEEQPASWRYPIDLALAAERRAGPTAIAVNGARLEHFSDGVPPLQPPQILLSFHVRFTNVDGIYGVVANGGDFRLVVDGIPWAPMPSRVEALTHHATMEDQVAFVMPSSATRVFLRLGIAETSPEIPIDLSAARTGAR